MVDGGTVNYETRFDIDPDALAIGLQGEVAPEYFEAEIVAHLEDHEVASGLRAVQEGRVIDG